MTSKKYGIDLKSLGAEYRSKLMSLESYLSNCDVKVRNLRDGDAFWLALETAYNFKIDRTLTEVERIGVSLMYISAMSNSKRRAMQKAARGRRPYSTPAPAVKKAMNPKLEKTSASVFEMPPSKREKDDFYSSWEWATLRKKVLNEFGARCQCCGATKDDVDSGGKRVMIQVDHIKSLHHHWSKRLDQNNLQVLCRECNMGKGAWDETDHRP